MAPANTVSTPDGAAAHGVHSRPRFCTSIPIAHASSRFISQISADEPSSQHISSASTTAVKRSNAVTLGKGACASPASVRAPPTPLTTASSRSALTCSAMAVSASTSACPLQPCRRAVRADQLATTDTPSPLNRKRLAAAASTLLRLQLGEQGPATLKKRHPSYWYRCNPASRPQNTFVLFVHCKCDAHCPSQQPAAPTLLAASAWPAWLRAYACP